MNNSLSEDTKRGLYQLSVERKGFEINARAGAFAVIAGTLIAIGNFFKAQGNKLGIMQEINRSSNTLSDKEIEEQVHSLKKQLAELKDELKWIVKFLAKTEVNISVSRYEKYNLSELILRKSLEPDELALFGSQIVVLGGICQATAGTLLAIANTIGIHANRLSIQNKIKRNKKNKSEAYLNTERQLKDLKSQIGNLQRQILFIEKFFNNL